MHIPAKAAARDYEGRFREIISDPINLLIERTPKAGTVEDGFVYLHNGNRVPLAGQYAYYGEFSRILLLNRGVHEPLEEYLFQEVIKEMDNAPTMLELGCYWAHYSMWMKQKRPNSSVIMVDPDLNNISSGKYNFDQNGYYGEFIQEHVGTQFRVDDFLSERKIRKLSILHSDIQGYEAQMLVDCRRSLSDRSIDYFFISTHSQPLHDQVSSLLAKHGYRIEIASDFDHETTSYDGLVFASSPLVKALFTGCRPLGREQIASATPFELTQSLLTFAQITR
jgi:hypothetical protein